MKYSIPIENNNNEVRDIALYLREFYPIVRYGGSLQFNGYYAENWQLLWKTPDDATDDGYIFHRWHFEFDDEELRTLLILKGLL